MTAPVVLIITYAGTLIPDQITTSPWSCAGAVFPDRGGVPYLPQFDLEVLQPKNIDGARYRAGGAHFPPFKLITIVPASDYSAAMGIGRQHELCKGDFVTLANGLNDTAPKTCAVLDVRAIPNAKSILGATASSSAFAGATGASAGAAAGAGSSGIPGGGANQAAAAASVDTEWTLQVMAS